MSLRYPPEWRAEDNYRLHKFKEYDNIDCLWRPDQAGVQKLPEKWQYKGTKDKKTYHSKKNYEKHWELLEKAFGNNGPFMLKKTSDMGIGVFARRTITHTEFRRTYNKVLCGFVTKKLIKKDSHSEVCVKVCINGKHCKKGGKRDMEIRNLYGPMVFVNHACERHAHCVISQRKNNGENPFPQMKDNVQLRKGEQLFIWYGDDYNGVFCKECKIEKMAKTSNKHNT